MKMFLAVFALSPVVFGKEMTLKSSLGDELSVLVCSNEENCNEFGHDPRQSPGTSDGPGSPGELSMEAPASTTGDESELEAPDRRLSLGPDDFIERPCVNGMIKGLDFKNWYDYRNQRASVSECADICNKEERCFSWSWDAKNWGGWCHLKDHPPAHNYYLDWFNNNGLYSGVPCLPRFKVVTHGKHQVQHPVSPWTVGECWDMPEECWEWETCCTGGPCPAQCHAWKTCCHLEENNNLKNHYCGFEGEALPLPLMTQADLDGKLVPLGAEVYSWKTHLDRRHDRCEVLKCVQKEAEITVNGKPHIVKHSHEWERRIVSYKDCERVWGKWQ